MSEQQGTPKITSTEKSEKIKDPRRVEAGKRLAAISREAKEIKATERSMREAMKNKQIEIIKLTDYIGLKYFIAGVTVVSAVGGLYVAYRQDKHEQKEENIQQQEPENNETEHSKQVHKKEKKPEKNLDSFG